MIEQWDILDTPDGPMGLYVVRPDGDEALPAVVSFHHGPGLDDGSKEAMARIAGWGYVVVSHDRYHRDGEWIVMDMRTPSEEDRNRFFEIFLGATDERVAADLDVVLAFLDGDPGVRPGPMGCVGYCIGGRSVLRALAAHPDRFRSGVALHPSRCTTDEADSPHLSIPSLTASLYVGFGAEDTSQSPADNQDMIGLVDARPTGEVEIHDGAVHGFAVPGRSYHPAAADRSYDRARALFAAALA
ncbi:MAG TPA: dienelactone hydrolase family protein [Iamia sp.]|nr:dienelactone hydrolase family protein [Iamia sp.]